MTAQRRPGASRHSRRSVLGMFSTAASAATASVLATGCTPPSRAPGTVEPDAAKPPAGRIPDLEPGGAFDRAVAELAAKDEFSGAVLVARHGEHVLERAHRSADAHASIPNRPDTLFDVASVGKIFTAVAVLQLAEQGELAFGGTVGTYLEGFPAEIAETVTVHHLLTHTSGMRSHPDDPAYQQESRTWSSEAQLLDGTMKYIKQAPLEFTPGTRSSYSNNGYITLGAIVQQVSGQSFYDYVRQHVFTTAGMTRTDFYPRPRRLGNPDIARPYAIQNGSRVDVADQVRFTGSGAGGACAPAADLVRFARALMGGELLSPVYTELLIGGKVPHRPQQANAGSTQQHVAAFQGYGPGVRIVNGHRVFGHGGGLPGVASYLEVYPDLGWDIVLLSNYNANLGPLVDQARQLITA